MRSFGSISSALSMVIGLTFPFSSLYVFGSSLVSSLTSVNGTSRLRATSLITDFAFICAKVAIWPTLVSPYFAVT